MCTTHGNSQFGASERASKRERERERKRERERAKERKRERERERKRERAKVCERERSSVPNAGMIRAGLVFGMSGRHGVQYVAQCAACAALTLIVWL